MVFPSQRQPSLSIYLAVYSTISTTTAPASPNSSLINQRSIAHSSPKLRRRYLFLFVDNLLEEKRAQVRKGMLLQVPALHRGYVDTRSGLNLTSNTAMEMVRRKEVNGKVKRARENLKRNTQEQRQLTIYETKRRRGLQLELDALYSRVRLYNDPLKLPRSMKERRLAARQRAQEKRVASFNGTRRERG